MPSGTCGMTQNGARDLEPAEPIARPSVFRNTWLAFVTQAVTAVLTAILTLFLTRRLGPHAFGEFSLALSVAGVLLLVADLGIAPSASRFIAERRDDRRAASLFLGDSLALKLVVGFLSSAALFVFASPLAHAYGDPGLAWPFRGAAVVLFGQSLFMLYSSALVAVGRIAANLGAYTAESLAETLASIVIVALGGGASGAAFGRAIGYAVGVVTAVALAYRAFGMSAISPNSLGRGRLALIARYAGVMFVVNGIWTLLSTTPALLIGGYAGSTQVGLFSAPIRLAALLHYPGLAVQNSVAPRLARTTTSGPDVGTFRAALRWLVILQAAMVAAIIVWARPIIELLLGPSYAGSAAVLRALAPFVLLQGIGPLVSVGVNYLGESRRRVPIALASLIVELIAAVILIPEHGALGGAIAATAGYVIYVPGHLLICRDLLSMSLRPLAMTVARSLIAAAAAAGVLALFGTASLDLFDWLVGGASAIVVYIGVLLAVGELTAADAARGYAAVKAAVHVGLARPTGADAS
jgi:O-antigen/teichoic acid export membrane protein